MHSVITAMILQRYASRNDSSLNSTAPKRTGVPVSLPAAAEAVADKIQNRHKAGRTRTGAALCPMVKIPLIPFCGGRRIRLAGAGGSILVSSTGTKPGSDLRQRGSVETSIVCKNAPDSRINCSSYPASCVLQGEMVSNEMRVSITRK